MKRIKQLKGYSIAEYNTKEAEEMCYRFGVYENEEYSYGYMLADPTWFSDSIDECIDWIKSEKEGN